MTPRQHRHDDVFPARDVVAVGVTHARLWRHFGEINLIHTRARYL